MYECNEVKVVELRLNKENYSTTNVLPQIPLKYTSYRKEPIVEK